MLAVFEEQHVQPGVQLIIAVTLAKVTLKKNYLLFRKMSAEEKHTALNQKESTSVQS